MDPSSGISRSYPQSTMTEPVERPAEEVPTTPLREEATTPKLSIDPSGVSAAAAEILNMFDLKAGDSPEAVKVRTIIQRFEENRKIEE